MNGYFCSGTIQNFDYTLQRNTYQTVTSYIVASDLTKAESQFRLIYPTVSDIMVRDLGPVI